MNEKQVLLDWLDTLANRIESGLKDASPEVLHWRPDREANSIALTLWHISRAWDLLKVRILEEQSPDQELWYRCGWRQKTGYDPCGKGWGGFGNLAGYNQAEVAQVPKLNPDDLLTYFNQVYQALRAKLDEMGEVDLRTIKGTWTPHGQSAYGWISNFVRDGYEHWGEIKALRAMWERRSRRGVT